MVELAKNQLCEIFGVVQFSAFATLSGVDRTSFAEGETDALDPNQTKLEKGRMRRHNNCGAPPSLAVSQIGGWCSTWRYGAHLPCDK